MVVVALGEGEVLEVEARRSPLAAKEAEVEYRLLVEGEVLQERSMVAVAAEAGRSMLVVEVEGEHWTLVGEELLVLRSVAEAVEEVPKRQAGEAGREHLKMAKEEVRVLWTVSSGRAVMMGEVEAVLLQLVFWEAMVVQVQVLLSPIRAQVVVEARDHGLAAAVGRSSALRMAEAHQIYALTLSYLRQESLTVGEEVEVRGRKTERVFRLQEAAEVRGTSVLAVKVRVEEQGVIRPLLQTFWVREEEEVIRLVARLVEEAVP